MLVGLVRFRERTFLRRKENGECRAPTPASHSHSKHSDLHFAIFICPPDEQRFRLVAKSPLVSSTNGLISVRRIHIFDEYVLLANVWKTCARVCVSTIRICRHGESGGPLSRRSFFFFCLPTFRQSQKTRYNHYERCFWFSNVRHNCQTHVTNAVR